MPLYEYECTECGHRFEQYRKATERAAPPCVKCSGRARKVFGAVGIIFKGSGFHSTDYRKPEEKKRAEEEKPAPAAASSKKADSD